MLEMKERGERAKVPVVEGNPKDPSDGEEYVRWAYRLLLGREPENAEAIRNNPFKNDRQRLVRSVLSSDEFRRANSDASPVAGEHSAASNASTWQPRNERQTCVCGAARHDIPHQLYRPVRQHDFVTPAYFYRCQRCGTLSAVNLYFNVESYSRVPIEDYCIPDLKWQVNRARVEWIRARAGSAMPENPVVYDLGSGEGCFTACVPDAFPHARVVAVETDQRMRQRFATEYERAEFVPEFIESFLEAAQRDPQADLINLTDVLEHVLQPEALLGLVAGALKPSGFAYITLPNADSYGSFPYHVPASEVDWNLANWPHQHLWMMQPQVLNDLMNRTFVLREMSRTFETNIRRDADYSTFLVQRVC
jgi:SAM-dependent methyltransferase